MGMIYAMIQNALRELGTERKQTGNAESHKTIVVKAQVSYKCWCWEERDLGNELFRYSLAEKPPKVSGGHG